ncbi:hypothetical protein TNCV_4451251 [Trichonephila clavipes]|nr:hypothetical protein TNCV_4451251 [Trichonephila clavipes]
MDKENASAATGSQESPDESPLAVDAGGHTVHKGHPAKKRTTHCCVNNITPWIALEISSRRQSYGQDRRRKA